MFPSAWLSVIFASRLLNGMITAPFRTHTCIHAVFPVFALSPFSLPSLSYSASPGCMCQWHAVVLCGGPSSGTAVPHKSAPSFNRYWQSCSLCRWIFSTYCIFIFLSILSLHSTHHHLWILPLFSSSLHFITLSFSLSVSLLSVFWSFFGSLPWLVGFCVPSRQTTHGEVNAARSLKCLQLTLCNMTASFPPSTYPALKSVLGDVKCSVFSLLQFVMQSSFLLLFVLIHLLVWNPNNQHTVNNNTAVALIFTVLAVLKGHSSNLAFYFRDTGSFLRDRFQTKIGAAQGGRFEIICMNKSSVQEFITEEANYTSQGAFWQRTSNHGASIFFRCTRGYRLSHWEN